MAKLAVVNLLLLGFVCFLVAAAPAEDQVHIPIAGYADHKWYSGIGL